ncbi:conserved exported hypothetical protein [Hyphomicrobium sp. GJ21]|jgi:hypothetical protein|uniref:DUF2933 domain-containing protein n=1 Tax=unclassified Hyphomicrobium TaxID=2619925 RepID=UPI000622BC71|nr:DUF2933 domain-containing protein [Hyphomicrobium sp. GJ21]CEJ87955.1 conserved exported hypothetical protein [Hyphomicrobium sp. GJ21]
MNHREPAPFQGNHLVILLTVLAAVALAVLWPAHGGHFLNLLPIFLVLMCPLMHLFMHHGHRHHKDEARPNKATDDMDGKAKR